MQIKTTSNLGVVVMPLIPAIGDTDKRLAVHGYPRVQTEFNTTLSYLRLCLNTHTLLHQELDVVPVIPTPTNLKKIISSSKLTCSSEFRVSLSYSLENTKVN